MSGASTPSRWAGLVRVLRWFGVLPGAILAMVMAAFPIHWVILLLTVMSGPDPEVPVLVDLVAPVTLERFALNFAFPAIFVAAGARIAPDHRIETSRVLAGCWVAGFLFLVIFAATQVQFTVTGLGWLEVGINCVLQVFGLVAGLTYIENRVKDQEAYEAWMAAQREGRSNGGAG